MGSRFPTLSWLTVYRFSLNNASKVIANFICFAAYFGTTLNWQMSVHS